MSDTFNHEADAWDQLMDGDVDEPSPPDLRICKYCRTGGLHWEDVDGKWKLLHSNGKIHDCKKPITEF